MSFKKTFFYLLLSTLLLSLNACSQSGQETTEKPQAESPLVPQKQDLSPPDFSDQKVSVKVEPIKLSPEDQKKADNAPPGMAFIKGGCFYMGNLNAQVDEQPEHEVCLDDFYMDRYEVTQERWEKVMGYNPAKFIGKDRPVEQINYYDIQKFIKKSNGTCRLPTEAEWEYAARAGTSTRYYWGNMMEDPFAWYEGNGKDETHPVGQKSPNQFGLYDMAGNVWEWVEDWYEPTYSAEVKKNPTGPVVGENKVIRGGSFGSSAGALRPTNRTWVHPKNRVYSKISTYGGIVNEIFNYIGFRCAKSIESGTAE